MPVAITGMVRSGGAVVAELLRLCGLFLGDESELVLPSAGSWEGWLENRRFMELNRRIIDAWGGTLDVAPAFARNLASDEAVHAALAADAEPLVRAFGEHEPWGWKDPRTSLTLPFWLEVVPELKVVVALRNPLAVAASLRRVGACASDSAAFEAWRIYYDRIFDSVPPEQLLLTDVELYFGEDRVEELRRVADFVGLDANEPTLAQALSAVRGELRTTSATTLELIDAGAPWPIVERYRELSRAARVELAPQGDPGPAASDGPASRDDRADDHEALLADVHRLVSDAVPAGATIASVGGDLQSEHAGFETWILPDENGDAGSRGPLLHATTRLEALRRMGADFVVLPRVGFSWLAYDEGFNRYLRQNFELVAKREETAFVYRLAPRTQGAHLFWRNLRRALGAYDLALGSSASVLDWHTGLDLARELPERAVVSPVNGDVDTLPYLDTSIDIVALPASASAARRAEAARVAAAAVVACEPGDGLGRPAYQLEPKVDASGRLPSVAVVVPPGADGRTDDRFATLLADDVLEGLDGEVIVAAPRASQPGSSVKPDDRVRIVDIPDGLRAAASVALAGSTSAADIVVAADPALALRPDAVMTLVTTLSGRPDAGAVGARLLDFDGRLLHAGGETRDGNAALRGRGDPEADAPKYTFVRVVDFCALSLLAFRRELVERLDSCAQVHASALDAAAGFGRELEQAGWRTLYQPDAVAVRVGASALGLDDRTGP